MTANAPCYRLRQPEQRRRGMRTSCCGPFPISAPMNAWPVSLLIVLPGWYRNEAKVPPATLQALIGR